MDLSVFYCCVVALMGCWVWQASALVDCYQCNVFSKGKQQICEMEDDESTKNDLVVSDCLACLKTFTFTSIHDKWYNQNSLWHRFRHGMTYVSKYCLTELDFDHTKDEGCYNRNGPNGFTRQCYCYGHLCNSSLRTVPWSTCWLLTMLGSLCSLLALL